MKVQSFSKIFRVHQEATRHFVKTENDFITGHYNGQHGIGYEQESGFMGIDMSDKALRNSLTLAVTRKHLEEAERLALEFTRRHPKDVWGWKVLGAVLARQGKSAEAVDPMLKSVGLSPLDEEARLNLGLVFQRLGQYLPAEEQFLKALATRPENPETLNCLGNLYCDWGRPEEAERYYRQAMALIPDKAMLYSNLGNALLQQQRFSEAEMVCARAIELQPDYGNASLNLGAVLHASGRYREAEGLFRKAIALMPNEARAHNNLGSVLLDLGHLDEARASFDRAIQVNPGFVEGHNNLSQIKTYTPDDPHVPIMTRIWQDTQQPNVRMHVCFALGKACSDLKLYQEAFALLSEGNHLRKGFLGYDIEQDIRLFDRIYPAFGALMQVQEVSGGEGGVPGLSHAILIVGMPRTGTSLVEQILASHPEVTGGGEREFLNQGIPPVLDVKPNMMGKACRQVIGDYVRELDGLREGRQRITDKMPLNFRWLGFLLWAHPELKVIHTRRDPLATCWSIFKQYFPATSMGFPYDLSDLGTYYRLYENLMNHWHSMFPGRIYELNYERLTEHQEEETRRLLDYCDLPWDERCLSFEKTDRPVHTASASQVRRKMYQGSSAVWKSYEPYLAPLIKALGRDI